MGWGSELPPGMRLRVGSGARAVEAELLARLALDLDAMLRPPLRLAAPLRVVVPSSSLREHLCAALLRQRGRAVVGVRVQTLAGAAREILERAGEPTGLAPGVLAVLVAREGRGEPALRAALGALRSGFDWVAESVADLLDAGLQSAHAEALDELLCDVLSGAERDRARAVLRVARRVRERLAELGLARAGDLLERARELLERSGAALYPAFALHVHGFADATGRASDLLESLLRHAGGTLWLDAPPDPWTSDDPAPALDGYLARLRERLQGASPSEPLQRREPRAALRLRVAHRPEDEVRAVATDVRALLDAGAEPESIGVVAADLGPWIAPLRTQLRRLGVPFSGGRRAPAPQRGPALDGLLALLDGAASLRVTRWLELLRNPASGAPLPRARRSALALALHAQGVSRLGAWEALDFEVERAGARVVSLPVPRGFGRAPAGEPRLVRQSVEREALVELAWRARAGFDWERRFRAAARPGAAQAALVLEGVRVGLGWSDAEPACVALREALAAIASWPERFELDAEELCRVLARALEPARFDLLGGEGSGVQLLDVTEARSRCFDALFVLGLERDAFPRARREDPLLPDAARVRLAQLLPDIPIRARAHEEERHLFAQLLSASSRVVLSRSERGSDGSLAPPSSFAERLLLCGAPLELERAPTLGSDPRTAVEHAQRAAQLGGPEALARRLALAYAEGPSAALDARSRAGALDARSRAGVLDARSRAGVLDARSRAGALDARSRDAALDAQLREAAQLALLRELGSPGPGLGPYLGAVGPVREAADPRRAPVYVTALEALARCPWQAFLRRVLRVEPRPDPEAELPGLDPRRSGEIAHRVLEELAAELGAPTQVPLSALEPGEGAPLRWPDAEREGAALVRATRDVLRESGVHLPGLAASLAQVLRPRLEAARALLEAAQGPESALRVCGAEIEAELPAGGARVRALRFRADWVVERGVGPELLDFKTGRCFAQSARSREAQKLTAVESGTQLQALVYALVGGRGAYLFLDPQLEPAVAWCGMEPAAQGDAFERVSAVLLDAFDAGHFPPRLQRRGAEGEPGPCRFCEVREACAQGELSARARFASVLERAESGRDAPEPDGERGLAALLALPEPPA